MIRLKVNDLFCGSGGMGLGFKNAGFEIAGAWDFDKFAVQTYAHNIGEHVKKLDILEMDWTSLPFAHVWAFGFPCQDLSSAGKKDGWIMKCNHCEHEVTVDPSNALMSYDCQKCEKGELKPATRSTLFFEVMRLIDETKENAPHKTPPIIMAENVKRLKSLLPIMEREYKKRGYKMYHKLLNSKFWGVPQNRERYFVIGVHESIEKEFIFPEQQKYYESPVSTILETNVGEKYYIDDENAANVIEIVKNAVSKTRPNEDIGVKIFENGNIRPHRMDARKSGISEMQVTHEGNPAPACISSHVSKIYGKSTDSIVRTLTPREYARLQGFPDSFEIIVSDSQFYKQMGNAVTVNVAQAIAERIKMYLLSI